MKYRFADRTAVLATMHRKEQAIAPILKQELGIQLIVPEAFNTDQFGTFTREVKRTGDQLTAARHKAEKALELTGATLAIASEGSFGPHPTVPYLPLNREMVLLLDREYDLEVVGIAESTQTNYNHTVVQSFEAAWEFAQKIGFPQHGLVVMPDAQESQAEQIFKGIVTASQLQEAIAQTLSQYGKAHVETDMRALYNPTRMQAIAQATQELVSKLKQTCPQCEAPGFSLTKRKPGLPCGLCHFPTALTLTAVYQCQKCGFQQNIRYPEGTQTADPAQCLYCNP